MVTAFSPDAARGFDDRFSAIRTAAAERFSAAALPSTNEVLICSLNVFPAERLMVQDNKIFQVASLCFVLSKSVEERELLHPVP